MAPRAKLLAVADLLDDDHVFDVVAYTVLEARDRGRRLRDEDGTPLDRDGGEILEDVIKALRATATAERLSA